MRPLDFLGSLKLKLGVVIVAAVVASIAIVLSGERIGLSPVLTGIAAVAVALAMVRLLAHGMTFPLREMAAAARAMAQGDYSRRVTATSRDEVGELGRAFNTMAAELDAVDRMRRDLVANASHELRTPIGALRAKLENLADGVEPATPDVLGETLAQVERLSVLVEHLLDLSKLEAGVVPLERRMIAAGRLLHEIEAEWAAAAAAREVGITVTTAPSTLELEVDVRRMRQVLGNLVANALRHSPPGGAIRLHASIRNGWSHIEVADDGPGIDPADAERVFERFYRSDRARSADGGGAGLGLAIARWIVDLHGGRISIATDASPGCTVVLELPR